MLDFTTLAKLSRLESDQTSTATQPEWQAADRAYPTTAAAHSRDFLIGYLLHYSRLMEKMDRKGTIPVLQALLENEPENGEVYFLLARQYERSRNLPEALDNYERAATLCLDKPSYMLAAARTACLLGDRNKGLALVCNVISAYPIMAEAYYERGYIFEIDENWSRALRDYDMCTRLEPQNPFYWCAMARMYRLQKMFKPARRFATKALKLNPGYGPALEELNQIPFLEQLMDFSRLRPDEETVELARRAERGSRNDDFRE